MATQMQHDGRDLDDGAFGARDVRAEFPVLSRTLPLAGGATPLVYLDTAATAQKPQRVIDAVARYDATHNAAVHRSSHALAAEATAVLESCRARVAAWVGAPHAASVVFTRGATAALNLAAFGLQHLLRPGDQILLTEMEHHANLVPWIMVARRTGAELRHVPLTAAGTLDLAAFEGLLSPRTRVVALTYVSNVLGTINPVAQVAHAARRRGAITVVDAAQAAGHLPVDLEELGADLLAFSAHKAYGPSGLGFLVGRDEVLERLEPIEGGGEMIAAVHFDHATWAAVPHRFEAGTPNVPAAAGFHETLTFLDELGLAAVRAHEVDLMAYAMARLSGLSGLRLLGPEDPLARGGLVSFHDPDIHAHDLATLLDEAGVAVRAGHHCAQPLHRRLGLAATTRASFGVYTTHADIDALVDAIRFARRFWGR